MLKLLWGVFQSEDSRPRIPESSVMLNCLCDISLLSCIFMLLTDVLGTV